MVSVQLKIRAPGAKTFLQVIRARYGSNTHKVFVVYALATNIIVTANSMTGIVSANSTTSFPSLPPHVIKRIYNRRSLHVIRKFIITIREYIVSFV